MFRLVKATSDVPDGLKALRLALHPAANLSNLVFGSSATSDRDRLPDLGVPLSASSCSLSSKATPNPSLECMAALFRREPLVECTVEPICIKVAGVMGATFPLMTFLALLTACDGGGGGGMIICDKSTGESDSLPTEPSPRPPK